MNYHGIQPLSLSNGEGCRVVLWVAGCEHKCDGCQNLFTWDSGGGRAFGGESLEELMWRLKKPYIDGLTLSGGDPMYPSNRGDVMEIAKAVKDETGKSIWMYTGYEFPDIEGEPALQYIDVVVDGKFIKELKGGCKWAGSKNQKIWRKINGIWKECGRFGY